MFKGTIKVIDLLGDTMPAEINGEDPYDIIWQFYGRVDLRGSLGESTIIALEHVESGERLKAKVDFLAVDEQGFSEPRFLNEARIDQWCASVAPSKAAANNCAR